MSLQKYNYKILTTLVALILIGVGALTYQAFYSTLKTATIDDIQRQQKQLAAIAVGEIEHQFYDLQKRMETIALMPNIKEAKRGDECNQQLQKIVEVNSKEINNLGRIDKNGTFICAVNRTIIGEQASKYGDYFEKIATDPEHKPAISRLISPSGSANQVLALHVPVFDSNGRFNGTIGGAIYFDELQKQVLASTHVTQNSVVALYDDNGDVLYNPDPLLRGKNLNAPEVKNLYTSSGATERLIQIVSQPQTEGIIEYSLRNEPRLAAHKAATIMGRQWTVMVIVPLKDSEGLVARQSAHALFIGLCIVLIITATTLSYIVLRSKAIQNTRKK